MKYDTNEQGFEAKDIDVEITELWVTWQNVPAEYDEEGKETKPASIVPRLRYRIKPTKAGETVPWPQNKDMIHCDFDTTLAQAGKDFALNYYKNRPEVTIKETE